LLDGPPVLARQLANGSPRGDEVSHCLIAAKSEFNDYAAPCAYFYETSAPLLDEGPNQGIDNSGRYWNVKPYRKSSDLLKKSLLAIIVTNFDR
jgi:hypothetical protein